MVKKICYNGDGEESTLTLTKGTTFTCELLSDEYKFTVTNIKEDEIIIKVNQYGLSEVAENGGISLREKNKKFTLYKGKQLVLSAQTTDASDELTIDWK